MELDVIRRVSIVTNETGAANAAASLDKLASAQERVGDAAVKMGGSTERSAPKVTSAAGAYDRLRQSIDASYRAQVQIERGQTRIDNALQQGLITTEQAARSMELLRAKYALNDNAVQSMGKSTGRATGQLQQLSYQMNDVVTMAMSGASPFQILATQAGQFVQVAQMGEGGIAGTFSKLSAGLMAMVTPANLALGAVAALGLGLLTYVTSGGKSLQSADDALKQHADFIKRIKDLYGEASVAAQAYGRDSYASLQLAGQENVISLQDQLVSASETFLQAATIPTDLAGTSYGDPQVALRYKPFQQQIEDLRRSAAAGVPDIQRFRDAVTSAIVDLPRGDPIRELGKNILDATKDAGGFYAAFQQARATLDGVDGAAASAANSVEAFRKAFAGLGEIAAPALTDMERATEHYRQGLLTARTVGERAALEAEFLATQDRIAGAEMPKPRARPNRFADSFNYNEAMDSARAQLKQAGDALRIYDQGAAAIEAYRMQETILQAAQKEGMTLTADQRAGIEALTDSYAALLRERDKLKIDSDLTFERDQMGRSAVEQRVATTMRGLYGGAYAAHMRDGLAERIRENAALKETTDAVEAARKSVVEFERETASGIFHDLFSGLREGKDGFDALGDAAVNAADKIANKLMDAAIDDLLNALLPGGDKKAGGGSAFDALTQGLVDLATGRKRSAAAVPVANDNIAVAASRSLGVGSDAVAGGRIAGLNDSFRSSLGQMIADAKAAGFDIDINSGFRSVARQRELWDAALMKYGSPEAARKWVAPPVRSMHNFGMAADLGYDSPGAVDWAHRNAGRYGLNFPLSNENWHIEPVGARAEAAGRSLQEMASSAGSAARATSGLGSGLNDLTNSVASAASKIGQGAGGGIPIGGINYAAIAAPQAGQVFADGGAFAGGRVIPFARGDVLDRPTFFPMAQGNVGVMGEAGPEAIMPLRRLANGRLGVESAGKGGPGVSVIINNNAGGARASARESTNAAGQREVIVTVDEAVASAMQRRGGQTDRALASRGAAPRTRKLG